MIKIGDFARLNQVSVVTLRHYDEIGLFKPAVVDDLTGYRYYSVAQLPRLYRILALKDLGFSLEQIDQVLNGLTLDQLRGMLKLKQAEAQQQLSDEQARLARINNRLRQIEQENSMPNIEVVLKNVPPMRIVSRTVTIPTNNQAPDYLGPAFAEVTAYAQAQGAHEAGPCLGLWHQGADVMANEVAECALPIDRPLPGTDTLKVYELPGAQVAAVVHHGAFEGFQPEHLALLTWMEANGYRTTGPYREIYINHRAGHMDESATEIQYPVEKA